MKNLLRATIAMAAFAALFVVPSVASASPELTSPTGTQAPVGTTFIGTNVKHGTAPQQFLTTTPSGTMTCATATITGEVVKNDGTHFVSRITTFQLSGTETNPTSSHCAGFGGSPTSVTPSHTTNPSHNGVAALPWCLTASGVKDEFTLFGEVEGNCTNGKTRPITILYENATIGSCTYQRAQIVGTYTTHPADAVLSISGNQFTKVTGGVFCPASFEIHLGLTLTTDVSGAEGEAVYIK